jgi:3-hydroxy-9,10-secoandrosta-1,3,5(10)-triene-9,17-dione monooxygenase
MIMAQAMRQSMGGQAQTVTHEELVARAAALVPGLRERTAEADQLRRMPDANVAALKQAGLFKVLQPRRYGGFQMSLHTHIDVVAEIARGCTSTAWCVGVMHAHSWLMGLFPEAAQQDTFGADPDTLISAVIAPRGKARVVEGGYLLNGFWPFGSGCEHADWLFLGAAILDDAGETTDEGDLLVPVSDITIKDDWNVNGLRGTGSCSIVAKDVFVPKHRYLSLPGAIQGRSPGSELHDGWLYKSAAVPVLALAITPAALGAALAAFEGFTTRLPGREVAYTQREVQIEMPVTHLQVAEAATKIDVARLLLERCADDIQEAAERGAAMDFTKRARVRMDCAHAVRQCLEAVEIVYLASGGSGIVDASPTQRAWRDVHAINMHGLLNLQTNQEMYGRVLLGLKPNTPLI